MERSGLQKDELGVVGRWQEESRRSFQFNILIRLASD